MSRSHFAYYTVQALRMLVPAAYCRRRRRALLDRAAEYDPAELADRVEYYNRLDRPFPTPPEAVAVGDYRRSGGSAYYFDLRQYLRFFPRHFRFAYVFGDVVNTPEVPTIVKSRPIAGDNRNAVIMKLNRVRHFHFVRDPMRFEEKKAVAVWRGAAHQPHRKAFVEKFYDKDFCDVGQTNRSEPAPPWRKPFLSIARQLEYKFILCIEGNDVASALKWVMSSNSLCFMTRPRFETWFMEGRLVPQRHYVELREDYGDLREKIEHYDRHPDEALAMIACAHAHVALFRDRLREDLLSLMVLDKYARLSGQCGI